CTSGSCAFRPVDELLLGATGHDLDDGPALLAGERTALLDAHGVADLGAVVLVMRLELAAHPDHPLVDRLAAQPLDACHDGLFPLVGHDASGLGSSLLILLLAVAYSVITIMDACWLPAPTDTLRLLCVHGAVRPTTLLT